MMLSAQALPVRQRTPLALYRTGVSYLALATAAGLLAWALIDPRFRNVEGFPTSRFCFVISGAVACVAAGIGITRMWWKTALWGALAIIAQAASLQLIDAGSQMHYQHYRVSAQLLIIVIVQIIFVFAGLWRRRTGIGAWLKRNYGLRYMLLLGAAFWLTSAALSRDWHFYIEEILLAGTLQLLQLGNVFLAAASLPRKFCAALELRSKRWLETPLRSRAGVDLFAVAASVWVTVLAAVLSYSIYERHPHIPDEVSYLYQARYLAEGQLSMAAPPVQPAFDLFLMYYDATRWFSPLPPAWPAMLAVGVKLGFPWLVNPFLAGVAMLLTYALLVQLSSLRVARLAVLLLAASPWFVFMGMNFMNHTFALVCALAGALMMIRIGGNPFWALPAGLAGGLVALTRPLDGLIVSIVYGLWILVVKGRKRQVQAMAFLVAGSIVSGAALLSYNRWITGDAMRLPLSAYTEKYWGAGTNNYGFGQGQGVGWELDPYPGHSPAEAVINGALNLSSINIELLGWGTGSLLPLGLLLASGGMRRSDYKILAIVLLVILAYSGYWFSGGPDFGARYWYLAIIPLMVLTARGVGLLERQLGAGAATEPRVVCAVAILAFMTLTNYFPWRAVNKYHNYLGMRPDLRQIVQDPKFRHGLVLVRGNREPDYASAAIYNPIDLRGDSPIFAWDRDATVHKQLLDAFPDRSVWLLDGPSRTGSGFRFADGPSPAYRKPTN